MSDRDQENQKPVATKLEIDAQIQESISNNKNIFGYQNRSDNDRVSSKDDDGSQLQNDNQNRVKLNDDIEQKDPISKVKIDSQQDGNEDKQQNSKECGNKLSDMLDLDGLDNQNVRNSSVNREQCRVSDTSQLQVVNNDTDEPIDRTSQVNAGSDNLNINSENTNKNQKIPNQDQENTGREQQNKDQNKIQISIQSNEQKNSQENIASQEIAQQAINQIFSKKDEKDQQKLQFQKIQIEIHQKFTNQSLADKIQVQVSAENIKHSEEKYQSKIQQKQDNITQSKESQKLKQKQSQIQKPVQSHKNGSQKQQITQKQPQKDPTAEDKQYNKQLQQQMSAIKKNLQKKPKTNDKQKQKQIQKNKVNKTLAPTPSNFSSSRHLNFQQTAETKAQQLKMISTMALQKKKQNYYLLKEWDKRRAESLAIHGNMIQILQTQIDKRIKSSIQNIQIYSNFLREKIRQQQKYMSHPVINTKNALQNNSISKNIYLNCTVILNSLTDQNTAKCRKINDFIQIIKNDILRDSIQAHLQQSQKQLLGVRKNISNLKVSLRKFNAQTQQKTSQLALFFNQNAVNLNIDGEKDFYSTQIQFLQKAAQQTIIQKKLGESCLEYFHIAINQEIKRSKVIRDAMITFSKALQQCYNIQTQPAEIEQLSKAEQNKLIEQFYSLEQIFDERCLSVFKNHLRIDQTKMLTVEIFQNFLHKFQFQGFDCKIVLLKQFNVRYYPSGKNQANIQQNCYLVITVDKFIHLFLSKQKTDLYTKPDISIKATMKNLELKPVKSQMLDIIIKEQKRNSMISYFWQTKNDRSYRVEFKKKDTREEFIDYIMKLRG